MTVTLAVTRDRGRDVTVGGRDRSRDGLGPESLPATALALGIGGPTTGDLGVHRLALATGGLPALGVDDDEVAEDPITLESDKGELRVGQLLKGELCLPAGAIHEAHQSDDDVAASRELEGVLVNARHKPELRENVARGAGEAGEVALVESAGGRDP